MLQRHAAFNPEDRGTNYSCNIPQDLNLQQNCCQNLKPYPPPDLLHHITSQRPSPNPIYSKKTLDF